MHAQVFQIDLLKLELQLLKLCFADCTCSGYLSLTKLEEQCHFFKIFVLICMCVFLQCLRLSRNRKTVALLVFLCFPLLEKRLYYGLPDLMTKVAREELARLKDSIKSCNVIYMPQVLVLCMSVFSSYHVMQLAYVIMYCNCVESTFLCKWYF